MSKKSLLINTAITHIKEYIEENKLAILAKQDVVVDYTQLDLVDISYDYVEDVDGSRTYPMYRHVFQLGEESFIIHVFEEEEGPPSHSVYTEGSYDIHYSNFQGSEIYENLSFEDTELPKILNSLDYHMFFNSLNDLLEEFLEEQNNETIKVLYDNTKGLIPGLRAIKLGDADEATMIFETGIQLATTVGALEDVAIQGKALNR